MPSVSSPLSPGAQLLTNDKLLPAGPSRLDIGVANSGATPDSGVKKATAPEPLHESGTVSLSSTSPEGDTAVLSAEALQLLEQMGDGANTTAALSHVAHACSATTQESFDYFG